MFKSTKISKIMAGSNPFFFLGLDRAGRPFPLKGQHPLLPYFTRALLFFFPFFPPGTTPLNARKL